AAARRVMTELRDGSTGTAAASWSDALRLLGEWDGHTSRVMTMYLAGNRDAALALRREQVVPTRTSLEAILEENVRAALTTADTIEQLATDRARTSEIVIIAALLLALVI